MNNKIISFLLKKAKTNAIGPHRHAAAVVYKNRIISVGWNKWKTHPFQKRYGRNEESIFLHAEIDAIIKAINMYGTSFLKDCDLYVVRYTRSKKAGNSKPCTGCSKAIEAFSIKSVHHT